MERTHTLPPFSFFLLALAPDLEVRCGFFASFVRDRASDMTPAVSGSTPQHSSTDGQAQAGFFLPLPCPPSSFSKLIDLSAPGLAALLPVLFECRDGVTWETACRRTKTQGFRSSGKCAAAFSRHFPDVIRFITRQSESKCSLKAQQYYTTRRTSGGCRPTSNDAAVPFLSDTKLSRRRHG